VVRGSAQWPFKGVLDLLANRNLSQGTNAWTDIDSTVYTLETAGSEGFLNLLPVYVDHILYPTMTDAAFHTEVHHISAAGKDAGVVYAEMEAREHTPGDIMSRAIHTALYPGHCGYRSETGHTTQHDTLQHLHCSTAGSERTPLTSSPPPSFPTAQAV
jgi:Zn-dependent M16 (insulinase) family peptidase